MMDSETTFFENLRKAIVRGKEYTRYEPPQGGTPRNPLPSTLLKRSFEEQLALVDRFISSGEALNIETKVVQSLSEAKEHIVELIRTKDPEFSHNKHVMLQDHPELAQMQLWNGFQREAVTVHTSFESDSEVREKTIASFIGVTVPELAIAESATLIECTGQGRPRSTSLSDSKLV